MSTECETRAKFEADARLAGYSNFNRERGRYCHVELEVFYQGYLMGGRQVSAAQSAPAGVSEGWKLVPVEPTPEMLRAGVHQAVGALPIYRAMLLAAPAQPAAHDQGEVLTEHSGCGRGIQVDQLTVRMYPGDKVVMVRGRIGKALAASTGQEVKP